MNALNKQYFRKKPVVVEAYQCDAEIFKLTYEAVAIEESL
jgi:hypothetical protein